MAAPRAPAKGQNRTAPGRRPIRGALVQALLLFIKGSKAHVRGFLGSRNLTLARRSIVLLATVTGPPISCVYLVAVVVSHSTLPIGVVEYTTQCT